MIVLYQNIP